MFFPPRNIKIKIKGKGTPGGDAYACRLGGGDRVPGGTHVHTHRAARTEGARLSVCQSQRNETVLKILT